MMPADLRSEASRSTVLLRLDPQLDTNVLIQLGLGVPEFVGFAQAHQSLGLSYNEVVATEFLMLGRGTAAQLRFLEQQYGIQLIQDISLQEIDTTATRLQSAFAGDPFHRVLRAEDARVAATAGDRRHSVLQTC